MPDSPPELAGALAGTFTPAALDLLAEYLSQRAREARATRRADAEAALVTLERAVLAARALDERDPVDAPIAAIRTAIERGTARYLYAAQEHHAATQADMRAYWRGVKVQTADDVETLCSLIDDATPDWDALDELAQTMPPPASDRPDDRETRAGDQVEQARRRDRLRSRVEQARGIRWIAEQLDPGPRASWPDHITGDRAGALDVRHAIVGNVRAWAGAVEAGTVGPDVESIDPAAPHPFQSFPPGYAGTCGVAGCGRIGSAPVHRPPPR